MKKGQILKNFIAAIGLLGIILVLIWTFFYVLTRSVIDRNISEQTRSSSEAILYGIEEELLMLENSALELAAKGDIIDMLMEEDTYSFYRKGAVLSEKSSILSGYMQESENVVVFDANGRFFRLRGKLDNTALNRIYYSINGENGGVISISTGDQNYIGTCEAVKNGRKILGYTVLLSDEAKIERMLKTYNQSEDIGVILYSGDRILCSDKNPEPATLENIRKEAAVYEKEVGLSGFGLLLYSYGKGLAGVTSYFRLALPVTILILLVTVGLFAWYVKNKMVEPIELIRERTEKYLLKKQINAHFTVNTLNVIRALVYKGNKQEASDTCDELARLLRYANAGDDMILLSEEFYTLEQYLKIMCTRYQGMIDIEMDDDDFYEELLVPRMLLQPIVENAVTHGLAGSKGKISISAQVAGEDLFIKISDNGKGMSREKLKEVKKTITDADSLEINEPKELRHISLQNIERRIKTESGDKYGIDIGSELGRGTEVTVHLPVIKKESEIG
ncbi:MAG: histidine kinase [Lachnospiraceae bacterium]|nr:histidine kinase [Lachnospiraceae bacterium]